MRTVVALLVVVVLASGCASSACVPAPHGVISWYPAEGDAHDVVSGHDGSLTNVTFTAGHVHQAFWFDGQQQDAVNLGDVTAFNFPPTSSFSIEAWVNVDGLNVDPGNDGMVIVSLNYRCNLPLPDTVATENLAIQVGTWKAFFQVRDDQNNDVIVLSPNSVAPHTWIHLVGVRDSTCTPKQVRLYINGVLVNSVTDTTTGSLSNAGPDFIGRRYQCATNNPFHGAIDEVTIYNRALTACEIAALYNADCAGKCNLNSCVPSGCGC
jgi:hypothetical protein